MNAALQSFLDIVKHEVIQTVDTMGEPKFEDAVKLITSAVDAGGRVHLTGIGKPAHVATYMASLLSSTGIPAYYLHGTEAVHGSCGQLVTGDVVICISNSGETAEMKATAKAIRNNGCKMIAVTGNPLSWLAKYAEVNLVARVGAEGGPMNRAPRASILSEIIVLQALSVLLQDWRNLSPQEYVLRHPGGELGKMRDGE